jgi:hypothetical protein
MLLVCFLFVLDAAYGLDGEASQEQIEAVAKQANAHMFITSFPDVRGASLLCCAFAYHLRVLWFLCTLFLLFCHRAITRWWASAACGCPADRNSASPLRARCWSTRGYVLGYLLLRGYCGFLVYLC